MADNKLIHNSTRFNVANNAIDIKSSGISRDQFNASDFYTITTTDPGKNSNLAAGKFVFVYEA